MDFRPLHLMSGKAFLSGGVGSTFPCYQITKWNTVGTLQGTTLSWVVRTTTAHKCAENGFPLCTSLASAPLILSQNTFSSWLVCCLPMCSRVDQTVFSVSAQGPTQGGWSIYAARINWSNWNASGKLENTWLRFWYLFWEKTIFGNWSVFANWAEWSLSLEICCRYIILQGAPVSMWHFTVAC